MADAKASEFTPTSGVTGADIVPVIQDGANKVVTLSAVKTSYLDTLYQPLDDDLTAIAGVTSAANKIPYFTGAGTAAVADFTAAGRALVDDASAAAQCTTLGLGTGDTPTFAAAVLKAAAPDLKLIDSDAADGDAGVRLLAAATTTTAGAEMVDATFYQQVSGSPVAFLTADADGSITLGDGIRNLVLSGKVGDVTMYDSTPTLLIIDSDTADKDAGVSIVVAATATTAGAENVDLTITQQVSGSPVNVLVADADGSITLGDGVRPIALNGTVGDLTISDATPVLQFKDSSCTDADVNFDITANATDTGTTTEDIDVAFAAQVAGNKVTFINFDADGVLALGYGGQATYAAKLLAGRVVTPNTGTATPAATDTDTVYNNIGDGDGSSVTLPSAVAGLQFTICVMAAQTLTVTAGSGDLIRIGSSVTAAAGSISSNTVGSSVTLVAQDAETWMATSAVGSWSF